MLDIFTIRDQLNQQEFKAGRRQILLGRLSEAIQAEPAEFEEQRISAGPVSAERQDVRAFLNELRTELGKHGLSLSRGLDDPDELYVIQELRQPKEIDLAWIRESIRWVSKMTTVILEMILPGVAGVWLDRWLETEFLALLGFALGVTLGTWHLIRMSSGRKEVTPRS